VIRFSASLVVIALGLLVAGGVTGKLLLVYLAIAVSAIALVFLSIGAIVHRGELRAPAPAEAPGDRLDEAPAGRPAGTSAGKSAAAPAGTSAGRSAAEQDEALAGRAGAMPAGRLDEAEHAGAAHLDRGPRPGVPGRAPLVTGRTVLPSSSVPAPGPGRPPWPDVSRPDDLDPLGDRRDRPGDRPGVSQWPGKQLPEEAPGLDPWARQNWAASQRSRAEAPGSAPSRGEPAEATPEPARTAPEAGRTTPELGRTAPDAEPTPPATNAGATENSVATRAAENTMATGGAVTTENSVATGASESTAGGGAIENAGGINLAEITGGTKKPGDHADVKLPGDVKDPWDTGIAGDTKNTRNADDTGDIKNPADTKDSTDTGGAGNTGGTRPVGQAVTVVPGVPRYHRSECILIRFMGDSDLQKMPAWAARRAGCTACRACQPDGERTD